MSDGGVAGRLIRNVALAGTSLAVGLCGVFAGAGMVIDANRHRTSFGPLPALSERSTMYTHDGRQIGVVGFEDRSAVRFGQIPRVMVDAVVASEDRTFWQNPGLDASSMVRALVANAEAGRVEQGGSTITQQLAKNRYLGPRRDLGRKMKEAVLAVQLAERYSKERILTEYLNTVYFGQGAYGVRAAAERFFDKSVDELDLSDAALLAALIASPEHDNPFRHPDRAKARRYEVLRTMLQEGYATRSGVRAAHAEPVPSGTPPGDLRPRNHFVDEVQQRLLGDARLGRTEHARRRHLLRGGLEIFTTEDAGLQFLATAAVTKVMPDQPPFSAALAVVEPGTGLVRAMVGGPGFGQSQYNLATHAPGRQTGSAFKVVTLAAALEAGYSPERMVDGSSPCTAWRPFYKTWHTRNVEGGRGGVMTLRDATASSVNCAYARMIADIGPKPVVEMARRLGIRSDIPNVLPITLGVAESTPLEMASVAATFAAEGVRHRPQVVERVVASDGRVLIDNTSYPGQRAVSGDVARCEVDILRDVVMRGTGKRAALFGQQVAGKTGTTDEQSDAWFLGLTPQLAGAVWMGAPDGRVPMNNVGGIRVYGGTYPARIWQAFLWSALRGQSSEPFHAPTGSCQRPAPPPAPAAAPDSTGPVFDSSGGPVVSSGDGSGGGSPGGGAALAPPPAPAPRAAPAPAARSAAAPPPPPPAPKPIITLPKLPGNLGV